MRNNFRLLKFSVLMLTMFLSFYLIVVRPVSASLGSQPLLRSLVVLFFDLALFFWTFQIIGYWFYRIHSGSISESTVSSESFEGPWPQIGILVPIKDEPEDLVKRMARHILTIDYPNYEAIFIDNGTMPFSKDLTTFLHSLSFPLKLVRKSDTKGFKAGALNYGLTYINQACEYVLVLDADHAPEPNILKELLRPFQTRQDLAFVQAPQKFKRNSRSLVAQAFLFKQAVFYEHLCAGMSKVGTLFMVGTNMLIKKLALLEVGGFNEETLTEDIGTTFLLHQKGLMGHYLNKHLATGYPPANFATYHKQQRRWAIGTFQNCFFAWRALIRNPRSLRAEQWLSYLGWNGTFYLQGFFNLMITWSTILFMFTMLKNTAWTTHIFATSLVIFSVAYQAFSLRKSCKIRFSTLLLSQALFFGDSIIFCKAFIDFIFGRNIAFEVTEKAFASGQRPTWFFTVYHLLLFAAAIVSLASSIYAGEYWITGFFWVTLFIGQSIVNIFYANYQSTEVAEN